MVNSQGRGRTGAPPSRVPSANAALDPRAAGIVRFVRDEVVRQTGGDQRPSNNSTAQATATSSAPAVQPPAPQQSSISSHPPQLARPSSAIPIRAPSPSAESQASFSSRTTRGSGRRGGRGGPPDRPHKTTTPNKLPALLNPAAIDVYRCQALWYAARPGQESDLYHDRFPERKPFLDEAIEKLVKETVGLIKKDDGRDIVIYIETHRERAWMIDLAKKARVVVEYSTQDEVERYCQDHPEEEAFVVFATSQFTSKIRRDSVLPAEEIMSNKPFPDSGELASGQVTNGFPSGIGEHKRTASGTESNKDVEMANTAPESGMHTETVVAEPEYLQANGAMQTQGSTPAQVSEAVIDNATASKASNRVPKAKVAISNGNSSIADSSPAREANGSSVASGVTLPAASTMEEKGSLTALFFNKSHELIGMHQKAVQAPISASLNLQCLDDHYDPHGLIKHIDILAQSMVERSSGASGTNGADGANGANGANGASGASGVSGANGASGANIPNLVDAYDSDSDEEL